MLTKVMLRQAYIWGWIDEAYLDALVETGQLTEADKAEIMPQPSKIVNISKEADRP